MNFNSEPPLVESLRHEIEGAISAQARSEARPAVQHGGRRFVRLAAQAVAIVAAVALGFAIGARSAPTADASTRSALERIATAYSIQMNGSGELHGGYVETSARQAMLAIHAGSGEPGQAFLIILSGVYSSEGEPLPPGATPAHGPILALVVARSDYQVRDVAILQTRPHVGRLGAWHSF